MSSAAPARAVAGGLTALTGLAVAQLLARLISTKDGPVEAVGTWIIRHAPGPLAENAIRSVGHADKPILVVTVVVVVTAVVAVLAARTIRGWVWLAMALLALVGALAIAAQPGPAGWRLLPVLAGWGTWMLLLPVLLDAVPPVPAQESGDSAAGDGRFDLAEASTRRGFLTRVGVVAVLAGIAAVGSRYAGSGRRQVEQARAALRLPGVTRPTVPAGADLDVATQPSWLTPAGDFYRIDTALLVPAVRPDTWRLRIHGMVDHPIELSLDDLLARELTEDWLTLCCVSNEVGGDLIGNAWWSGVRIAPLLAEAGIRPGADGVLQTSSDGWTCLTPVEALTDDRNAMLALAMNGEPLPVEHGFPVRMVVPGLYGYVSATKWLVDLEVTRFDKAEGYWTPLGWSAHGPIKLGSRIDVARHDVVAGVAWHQHTGIEAVEVSVDGGPWTRADLGVEPTIDTWVQWRLPVELGSGAHTARVRAIGAGGELQTSAVAEPVPDGATGWDKRTFEVA